MGIASCGIIRAEGTATNSVVTGDKVVVQRYTSYTNQNNYYQPLEATVDEIASFSLAGSTFKAAGRATLVAGAVTVALASVTASSVIVATPIDATPNALGITINAGVGFTITSASGTDTSVVSYIVLN